MQQPHVQQLAREILEFSKHMLKMAQHNDWRVFQLLESQRQTAIDNLFKDPSLSGSLSSIADVLQQIIDLDRASIALGVEARDNLAWELSSMQRGRQALVAYQDNCH